MLCWLEKQQCPSEAALRSWRGGGDWLRMRGTGLSGDASRREPRDRASDLLRVAVPVRVPLAPPPRMLAGRGGAGLLGSAGAAPGSATPEARADPGPAALALKPCDGPAADHPQRPGEPPPPMTRARALLRRGSSPIFGKPIFLRADRERCHGYCHRRPACGAKRPIHCCLARGRDGSLGGGSFSSERRACKELPGARHQGASHRRRRRQGRHRQSATRLLPGLHQKPRQAGKLNAGAGNRPIRRRAAHVRHRCWGCRG
jgi:hypothetical protein